MAAILVNPGSGKADSGQAGAGSGVENVGIGGHQPGEDSRAIVGRVPGEVIGQVPVILGSPLVVALFQFLVRG